MKKKYLCYHCGKKIGFGYIRCTQCDIAWRHGYSQGEEYLQRRLGELITAILRMGGIK